MLLYPDSYRQVDNAADSASRPISQARPVVRPLGHDRFDQLPSLDDIIASILDASFARDQWSQRYLRSLVPIRDERLVQSVLQRPEPFTRT